MDNGQQAWERQEGESIRAYDAFCVYRDMPAAERSHRKTHDLFYGANKSNLAQISKWSADNNWVVRVTAYDDYLDAQAREKYEAERLKQRDTRQKIVQALNGLLGKVMQAQSQQTVMTPQELNALANAASKVLNESRTEFDDLPTQRVQSEISGKDGGPIEVKHDIDSARADILSKLSRIAGTGDA